MNLITDLATLQQFVPNLLPSVKGEKSLFDKISSHLMAAESWLKNQFIANVDNLTEDALRCCQQIVTAEALRQAIPSLDLVFTPNGFAVTQTSNLTPASKQRVDRLIASMLAIRDDAIGQFLSFLPKLQNANTAFFGATLFPNFALIDAMGITERKWEEYLRLRSQIIDLEASLAEEWFSPELMEELRDRNLQGDAAAHERTLITAIQSQILGYLRSESFNSRRLADIVNYIRINPDKFPTWHSSATAQLFAPPKFVNKKESHGYFF